VLGATTAAARPGGGGSFGGRSGGGGGGGSGDCAAALEIVELIYDVVSFLIRLTVEHPAIGVPLDLVVVGLVIAGFVSYSRAAAAKEWTTTPTAAAEQAARRPTPSRAIRRELSAAVARVDPDFSLVLFEDFLYALYASAHEARGKGQLATLVPYLRPAAAQTLGAGPGPAEVRTVVIGALRYVAVQAPGPGARAGVTVEIEANYTEIPRAGGAHTFYVVERWSLSRAPTARSRPPEKARVIGCPNCGAPLSALRGNQCGYCQQLVDTGAFDWAVDTVQQLDRMERPPQLTSDTEEAGTNLPTVIDPGATARLGDLTRKDPAFQWPHFLGRVARIFAELQPAWSTREWTRARPFVSDQLFQMLAYWIETYKRERLANVSENARITGIELCAVVSDRYFDAITVRVRATGLDYTVSDDGRLVSGSKTRERSYTEYWTLIRGSGARTKDVAERACPNCGAPLVINQAGSCTHCGAKVTSGEFDWVLSRIEQDEAYTG
jgi:uncharacterized Zn finger protein (UPF0148 family)